jgi:hypothetical protein
VIAEQAGQDEESDAGINELMCALAPQGRQLNVPDFLPGPGLFANPAALPAAQSELTMVDGRIVWETGAVQ